jgi:uncharacterized membrane protein
MARVMVVEAMIAAAMMAGLMTVLLVVMRPMWRAEGNDVAARHLQDFLALAARNPILVALTILPWVAAIAALLAGTGDADHAVLVAAGGAIYFAGFTAWTVLFNLPLYRRVAAWRLTTDSPTSVDLHEILGRFDRANSVRFAAALIATLLFALAM